jgi:hypothetical protein
LIHPPSLPDFSHRRPPPPEESNRTPFRLVNLRPWGNEKPRIHRSASSPQLTEFAKEEKPGLKELRQEKVRPVLKRKKSLKQEKRPSSSHVQCMSTDLNAGPITKF